MERVYLLSAGLDTNLGEHKLVKLEISTIRLSHDPCFSPVNSAKLDNVAGRHLEEFIEGFNRRRAT